ncbi:MAG: D-sedoheptulose 7-phosphate isomerase [Terracidiphilus sp.]
MKELEASELQVRAIIASSIDTKRTLLEDANILGTIARMADLLIQAFLQGNKLILFGNGGSAADAQHIAAEFVGRFAFDRPALPAMALSVNSSAVTAIGNDYGFDRVFARQLEAFGRAGDVAIGISTSGNSPNVLEGIATAKAMGIRTMALTGQMGGQLRTAAEFCICAPSDATPRIQECHILIGHIISELAEEALFAKEHKPSGS